MVTKTVTTARGSPAAGRGSGGTYFVAYTHTYIHTYIHTTFSSGSSSSVATLKSHGGRGVMIYLLTTSTFSLFETAETAKR